MDRNHAPQGIGLTPRHYALLAAALLTACSPSAPSGPSAPSTQGLAPFAGPETQLFDDTLSPEIFGAPADPSDPLEERARRAEGIVPSRIRTVTRDLTGEVESYVLDVMPSGPALKGPNPSTALSLTVPPANPSFPLVSSTDSRLVGTQLLLFYKRYADGGQVVLHWRAELDGPRVRQVIENAKLMSELGR